MTTYPGGMPPVLIDAGASYRQIDHWIRQRYLQVGVRGIGFEHAKDWTGNELAVAIRMVHLVKAGFRPEIASTIARRMVDESTSIVLVNPNIAVEVFV